jgi:hypothetical protein
MVMRKNELKVQILENIFLETFLLIITTTSYSFSKKIICFFYSISPFIPRIPKEKVSETKISW